MPIKEGDWVWWGQGTWSGYGRVLMLAPHHKPILAEVARAPIGRSNVTTITLTRLHKVETGIQAKAMAKLNGGSDE